MNLIAISNRAGETIAHAQVDAEEATLGEYCWLMQSGGYAVRVFRDAFKKQHSVLMHRAVLGLSFGDGLHVDHINRDKLDNRKSNLRVVTLEQNAQNRPSNRGSTSQHRGVSWATDRSKWRANASLGGRGRSKSFSLGYFDNELEAAAAASEFRIANMPFAVEAS